MGIKINRNKKRHFLLSLIYRFDKIIFIKNKAKFKLYLDLEWIFNRLSHEYSFKIYPYDRHPNRIYSKKFILKKVTNSDRVLDLGCSTGDFSKMISTKASYVLGIDYDEAAINIANNNYKDVENLEFVFSEAYDYLENNTKPFDVLILSHILEHIDNPTDFLSKFSKFFEKIYIEVPDFDVTYLNHYRQEVNCKLIYTDNDHVYEFDRTEIIELVESCDLVIDLTEYRYGVQKIWCSHH